MRKQLLILCAIPFLAVATAIPEKDWEYEQLDDDHVVIHNADQSRRPSAIDQETAGDITVPATLRNMQVVSIGEKAFYGCSKLTSVIIPEGVTNIAENAFYGCSSLTNVVFPTSLKSIGTYAFYNCSKLSAAHFMGASLDIGTHAFRNCSSVTDLTFAGDQISIGENAFSGCTGLRDVSLLAKSVMTGKCSFSIYNVGWNIYSSACTALTNLLVQAADVSLATVSFSGCTALKTVTISASSLTVGDRAFSRYNYYSSGWTAPCSALALLAVDADTVTLGVSSFSECASLERVDVSPSDLMSVGDSAFSSCTSLKQFDVSSSNLTVGASAFSSCSALGTFAVESATLSIGNSAFAGISSLSNVLLAASSLASIGESAFSGCSKLQCVGLPVALTEVAENVFYQCKSLEGVSFSTNLTKIAYRAFDTCTSLKSIGFSEGLTGIDAQAFYGCESITNLVFPQSLSSIGSRAFERCDAVTDIVFAEGDTNLVAAKSVTVGERAFYRCCALANVRLSQAVLSIGSRVFSQCESLASVNLPSNLTDIAESTFEDCATLPEIDLPVTLRSIGNAAFARCSNLATFLIPTNNVVTLGAKAFKDTKYWYDYPDDLVVNNGYILGFKNSPVDVTLPDGCKSIPVAMFEGMTTLKSVTIPDSVTEIGSRAFNGCSGITNLSFRSVTTIGNSAFEGCSSLTEITLSDVLTAIPGNCFKDCMSLTAVFIPDPVSSIGEYAFYNCASLATVTGGKGVSQVGDYAFAQCPTLQPFEFPNSVAYGDHVYQGCTWTEHVLFPTIGTLKDEYPASYMNITSVVFSSNMTTITNGACAGCTSLAYIRIPDGVTSIGALAFDECSSLTSVVMSATVKGVASNSFAGCSGVVSATVTGDYSMQYLFPASYAKLTHVGFVEGVTSLVSNFMAGCSLVVGVQIPEAVTSIGASAFRGCTGFSEIVLPISLVSVGKRAFAGCSGLTSLAVPYAVSSIGASAFADCVSLQSVDIWCANATAGSGLFAGCPSIKSVSTATSLCFSDAFPEVYKKLTSVELLEGMDRLVASAFEGCVSLATMRIPTSVTSIGDSAFAGCVKLSPSIIIPAAVTTMGDYVFNGCTGLKQVNYFGTCPANANGKVYIGSNSALHSGVIKENLADWRNAGTTPSGAGDAVKFWPGLPKNGGRRITGWAPTDEEYRVSGMMRFYHYDMSGTCEIELASDGLRSEPTHSKHSDYEFTGWYSKPCGGVKVTEDNAAEYASVYAHWKRPGDDDEEDDEVGLQSVSVGYDFGRANRYIGSVLDGETVVGTVQISFAKGKTNKNTGETTASATAKVQLLGEGQLTMTGSLQEDGIAELTASRPSRTMTLEISLDAADRLAGEIDGYEVVAYRDLFSSTVSSDKTRANEFLADVKGKYVAVFAAEGDAAFTAGYAPLSVDVGTKGMVKVSGVMPDGTSVSASAQLALATTDDGNEVGCATLVVPMYSSKGGFAFALTFEDGTPALAGVSNWIADKSGTEVPLVEVGVQPIAGLTPGSYAFAADISSLKIGGVDVEGWLSPDGTAFSATEKKWTLPKSDTVKFVNGEYVITKDNGNPAALNLTYSAGTGLFSGSFKVYGVTEAGRSKTYTATVRGGVLNGLGYGTAVIRNVGSVPVETLRKEAR